MSEIEKITELMEYLTDDERTEIVSLLSVDAPVWVPLPGPQTEAFNSPADVLFYGGAAGGGKSDLLCGLALTGHNRSAVFRRIGTEMSSLVDRMVEIVGDKVGLNMSSPITWRRPDGRFIEFGSCEHAGSEVKYQGRAHDLKAFDEITSFTESQFRYLCTWARTTIEGQRCRIVCAGNPPTDAEGEWIIKYFAPWLDSNHPDYPEVAGKLRWYAVVAGVDIERQNGEPFELDGDMIVPQSRTFIPSSVEDNPFLMSTGYRATLQALPEPLRSKMLLGDFSAGKEENPWQIIPTAWIRAAQERWSEMTKPGVMDSVGMDIARGGNDKSVISRRHGSWYDRLLVYPGKETFTGSICAGLAVAAAKDNAVIHVDAVGVGTSPLDHLNGAGVHVVGIVGSEKCEAVIRGELRFYNLRAYLWWRFREMLDPASTYPVALPPGQSLLADLSAPRWKLKSGRILVELKDDIIARLGRSPDEGEAVIYASVDTPKRIASTKNKDRRRPGGMTV